MVERPVLKARLELRDRSEAVVEAWKYQFAEEYPEVGISCGDIFEAPAECLVVPGNAFGFLDRGFELEVSERFGLELQDRLRHEIRTRFYGELLVGQAFLVETEGPFRWLLYTGLTRTPRPLDGTLNAYLAARGAFLALIERESSGRESPQSLVMPGIATGASGMHPHVSARQVRYAYEICAGKRGFGDKNLSQLTRRERKLCQPPRPVREEEGEPGSP